jgi:hypothetical protein
VFNNAVFTDQVFRLHVVLVTTFQSLKIPFAHFAELKELKKYIEDRRASALAKVSLYALWEPDPQLTRWLNKSKVCILSYLRRFRLSPIAEIGHRARISTRCQVCRCYR